MNNGMNFDPMTGQPLYQGGGTNDINNQPVMNNQGMNTTIQQPARQDVNGVQGVENIQMNVPVEPLPQEQIQPQVQPQPQIQPQIQPQVQPQVQPQPIIQQANNDSTNINSANSIQQQMQSIPTVDQNRQDFINNTQAENTVNKKEKKSGPNVVFIVILFVIIFAAIFFLFPYLLENL